MPCQLVCFGVSVGSLSADDWVFVFVLLVVWLRHSAVGVADSRVTPGLGYRWRPSWEFSLINIPGAGVLWQPNVLDSAFPLQRLGPVCGRETEIPQAVCYGNKGV